VTVGAAKGRLQTSEQPLHFAAPEKREPDAGMSEIIGLFPTPVMRTERLLDATSVESYVQRIKTLRKAANARSKSLCHTEIVDPARDEGFAQLDNLLRDQLVEFGKTLFGEELRWSIKEMWFNVMETGGFQSIHNHANSITSGVLYLTDAHPSSRIVFSKGLGGTEYVFNNFNRKAAVGPYNGVKWFLPQISAGDLILFPSYLLHEVPENRGAQRLSIAFNAIPDRLDSSGYTIRLSR
jgi:uncharacterized protein (TIGR02466 family)